MHTVDVLYADNHVVAVNKPAGLLTQVGQDHRPNLEQLVRQWVKQQWNKPGAVFLHAIHRLDVPVSGVVVFAKTSKALKRLQAAIRERRVQKTYWALVEGQPDPSEGILEHRLLRQEHRSSAVTEGGKQARLSYRTLSRSDDQSKLEIDLETGRYHQIRVQLAAIGHPIIGDTKYGGRPMNKIVGIALHHRQFIIPYPISGAPLKLVAPCPW